MSLTIADNYVSKSFGEYSLQVCKKTKYFNALHLLDVYNDSYDEKKVRKFMIQYMKRSKFMRQVDADFDFIVDKKLLNYEFLNSLMPVSQENTEDSDGCVLQPSQLSLETSETDLKALDKNIKYQYMVRKVESGYNKILSLDINPMSAVGLAMWLNPAFGSKVKDVFLRFIEGDANLIKETIQNLNNVTGLVNNLETTTDPETNEIAMSITKFEKNNYIAKIKNEQHKREIQKMIDEKNGIINKQKSDIDSLQQKMDKMLIQMEENRQEADEERKKAAEERKEAAEARKEVDEERKKADEERKKSEARFNKLLGVAEKSDAKLDAVLPQRVNIDMDNDPDVPNVYILFDKRAIPNECDLYVIRCQASSYKTRIKAVRQEYGKKIVKIYTFKQPNAIAFWKTVKNELSGHIVKDPSTNWFKLKDMTLDRFKYELQEHDRKRITK